MPLDDFIVFWEAITILEAQESLRELVVATFKDMKKSDREKTHKELYKKAYPAIFKETRQLGPEDLALLLSRG